MATFTRFNSFLRKSLYKPSGQSILNCSGFAMATFVCNNFSTAITTSTMKNALYKCHFKLRLGMRTRGAKLVIENYQESGPQEVRDELRVALASSHMQRSDAALLAIFYHRPLGHEKLRHDVGIPTLRCIVQWAEPCTRQFQKSERKSTWICTETGIAVKKSLTLLLNNPKKSNQRQPKISEKWMLSYLGRVTQATDLNLVEPTRSHSNHNIKKLPLPIVDVSCKDISRISVLRNPWCDELGPIAITTF